MPGSKLAIVRRFSSWRLTGTREESGLQREGIKQRPQVEMTRKPLERMGMVCGLVKGTGGDISMADCLGCS